MTQPPCCTLCGIESTSACVNALAALPRPALDQLLCSNSPPTHGTETLIKNQLTCTRDRIRMLDDAIENLQKARSLLKQEETGLTSVMSPIRRAPPEILSEIFTLHAEDWWVRLCQWQLRGALPEARHMGQGDFEKVNDWVGCVDEETQDKKSDQDLTDLTLKPSYVLTQVSHSWRGVALGCSRLWSDISLHPDYRFPAAQKLLREQLNLSANRPIRIHTSHRFRRNEDLFPLLQDILHTSHRWTSINIAIGDLNYPVLPISDISSPFPSLVSLSLILKVPDAFWGDEYIYKITAADAPLLREVSLTWPDYAWASVDLPWAQLRKFRFWGESGEKAIGITRRLREVIELDLLGVYEYGASLDALRSRPLHLPFLRCLRLSNVGCSNAGTPGEILPYLKVPALETLYWTGMKRYEIGNLYKMCTSQTSGRSGEKPTGGQKFLQHVHLYNAGGNLFEELGSTYEMWRNLFDAIGPQLKSFKIEYPISSGANVSWAAELLVNHIRRGDFPSFHTCILKGVHIDSSSLSKLIGCVESHNCDIRVRNSTLNTQEEFDDTHMMKLQASFPWSIPRGAFFELDIETPNRKILYYAPEFGSGLEESCRCRLEGVLPQPNSSSSVLRVV